MSIKQKTKTNFKKQIACGAIFLAFFVFFAPGFYCFANGVDDAKSGLTTAAKEMHGGDLDDNTITDIPTMIGKIVGAILAFVGTIFFILIIYAGLRWMLARGNEQEVQKAKDIIEASVIGLIIVLSAYAITAYVGDQFL